MLIVRDRSKATSDCILTDLKGTTIAAALAPLLSCDCILVSDGAGGGSYRAFADAHRILHVGLNTSADERTWGSCHIQNVNAYASNLKVWMQRFRGVATKYLPSYLGWRRLIDRAGSSLSAWQVIAAAHAT